MLITFQSKASADVIMFGDVAARLLSVLGKDPQSATGIVTTEQLPAAIAALSAAIEADLVQQRSATPEEEEDDEDRPRGMAVKVSLAQRAVPLLDILQRAQREAVPVIWNGS